MLHGIPFDLLMIYGLGLVAVGLILWIGRLPKEDFGPPRNDAHPSQNGD